MPHSVDGRYLRLRLAAALSLVAVATLGSYAVDRIQFAQIEERQHVAAALDSALATMAEQLVHLGGVRAAIGPYLAADDRNALERSIPALEETVLDLRAGLEAGTVAPATRAILQDPLLDPLALLKTVALNARAVAADASLWGEAASFHAETASATTMQALYLIRRVKEVEEDDLDRAAGSMELWRRGGVAVVLALLGAIWAGIFRPLERRVVRDQERLRDERRAAEAASEAKSAFLATVSHEIRTPLVGVLGAAELLRATPLDGEQDELAGTVLASGRALLGILDDVLDFAKIEAGRIEIASAPLDAAAVVSDLGRLFTPQARAKGVALRVEAEAPAVPRHMGDETRLRQVLANLVGNAVKFTERGAVTLRLAADGVAGGHQTLRFEVEDTGIGMTPAELGRMWEAFEQADGSTARRFGGTGLGLAIARRLAEAMGGQLTAESAPGRGSTFRLGLTLPVAPRGGSDEAGTMVERYAGARRDAQHPAATPPAAAAPRPPPAPPAASAAGPRVLVADDNATNRLIAGRMLSRAGCRVTTACDGAEAVATFDRERPHLVLMDISMPGVDGLEATRRIRALERRLGLPPTPIAAISAHVGEAHHALCLAAGADEVIGKPFRQSDFDAALDRLAPDSIQTEQRVS